MDHGTILLRGWPLVKDTSGDFISVRANGRIAGRENWKLFLAKNLIIFFKFRGSNERRKKMKRTKVKIFGGVIGEIDKIEKKINDWLDQTTLEIKYSTVSILPTGEMVMFLVYEELEKTERTTEK
jgi:hypothetical protein